MSILEDPDEEFVRKAINDQTALDELLDRQRPRLKEMLRFRINPQIRSRIDESDVIQDLMIDASRNFQEYAAAPRLPFYLWLRHLAKLKLTELHRRHLGTLKRSARKELSLEDLRSTDASTTSMAMELVSRESGPSEIAIKREALAAVELELENMDAIDREILALRHFEQLSVAETALELGLSKAGAGSRYIRALDRLRTALGDIDSI